ncbi:hypothetical protein A8806_105151 [Faecalicatena orotica]|uniref:Uncharacterized protein n=1 Tax=Faecalicatena orotica TaxID=1544 RepID=A0A2Y9BFF1_9FIRM|nr:hypothetical protein A8806_105151 [Faecalicatena orotica]SSA55574.1 hypothetical protein SAMN05216536_105151 [Faecalicatena orotica]
MKQYDYGDSDFEFDFLGFVTEGLHCEVCPYGAAGEGK